jgi:twitching motility protein PilU
MRTFDWSLFELYNDGQISYEEAIRNADSANELRLNIKLKSKRGEPGSATMEMMNLTLHEYKSPEEMEAERKKELAAQEEKKRQFDAEQLVKLQQEMQQLEQAQTEKPQQPVLPLEKVQLAIE